MALSGIRNAVADMYQTRHEDRNISNSITGIYRVPYHLRKLNEEAYTPQVISIGPFGNQIYSNRLQTMQGLKEEYSKRFWQRVIAENRFDGETALPSTVNEQSLKQIREFYGEDIGLSDARLSKLVLVDAYFILELFLIYHSNIWPSEDPMFKESFLLETVTNDLLLLENQLPFFFLEEVFQDAFPLYSGVLTVRQLTFEFFKDFNVQNISHENSDVKIQHFTDLLRTFLLPQSLWPSSTQLPQRGNKKVKLSYSATQLQQAGVKFKVSSNKCLVGLKFENGVLEIPCLEFYDTTEALIRNIMALEQTRYIRNGYVTDYFIMMDFLINTTKDMDLLCDNGIVDNYLGDNNAATLIVNNLHKNILWVGLGTEYCKLCESLNAFYKDPWHRWKAILKQDYFSTPWTTASTIAVAILLVLTFIQTVCSILQVL
ncbi:UPF0481 protein At3g47200-like [Quercus robur]|uniref:UPF0481 protein At3g47200-like n=1 Tax=Quercus robur TaxID=38942 RepID=UPI0021625965|nr:UPF0481 protein At3g47200-like [Quercus robur]XP_050258161.1 UPF0481 protein At3g47200-like [Quercus robur]